MNKSQQQLLIFELASLKAYWERLFHLLEHPKTELEIQSMAKPILVQALKANSNKLKKWLNLETSLNFDESFLNKDLEQEVIHRLVWLGSTLELSLFESTIFDHGVSVINEWYSYSHEIHVLLDPFNEWKIQLPRLLAATMSLPRKEEHILIPRFRLYKKNLKQVQVKDLVCLGQERQKKHQSLIRQGHHHILQKHPKKALECFLSATKIQATAQGYNLVAWVYGILGQLPEAKEYCLKAISLDPELGDAYNDMGSYLLLEGQTQECLKWFQLAKKAKHYVNREFPYINSGKAYLMQKKHKEALKEFSLALKFVPYQEELTRLIEKLKHKIELPTL